MTAVMSSGKQDGTSESPSRRAVLAALGGVVVGGLAGCSGNGGNTETPASGGEDSTETSTQGGGENTGTATSSGGDGNSNKLDIPGEVVHNGIDTVEVVAHGAYRVISSEMNFRVTIENTGDQPLTPDPVGGAENPLYIRARTLTSEGNKLQFSKIGSGPDEINPGTEETLRSMAPVERSQVARYELCIVSQDPLLQSATTEWQDVCGQ